MLLNWDWLNSLVCNYLSIGNISQLGFQLIIKPKLLSLIYFYVAASAHHFAPQGSPSFPHIFLEFSLSHFWKLRIQNKMWVLNAWL